MVNTKNINEEIFKIAKEKYKDPMLSTYLAQVFTDEDTFKNFNNYIQPDLEYLPDGDKAVNIIIDTVTNDDGYIILNCDYDCDGVSSGALNMIFFTDYVKYDKLIVIVNERKFGNGFNEHTKDLILSYAEDKKIKLIITSDHGSADEDRYKEIKEKIPDVKIIVTDHHVIPEKYPISADALVNPMRTDSEFNNKISGTAVAYFLMRAVYEEMLNKGICEYKQEHEKLSYLLPYVALSTISDQMSLLDNLNRHLVKSGLIVMNRTPCEPWNTLQLISDKFPLLSPELGFYLGPLINAGGRMGKAIDSFNFLVSKEPNLVTTRFRKLEELNKQRKSLENEVFSNISKQIPIFQKYFKNTFSGISEVGHGVAGIIAGRVGEMQGKSTIIFNTDEKDLTLLTGSVRAVHAKVDVQKVLEKIKKQTNNDLIVKSGGHASAAGVTINKDKFMEFCKLFDSFVKLEMDTYGVNSDDITDYVPNFIIHESTICKKLYHKFEILAPFGQKFPLPIFKSELTISKAFSVSSGTHGIVEFIHNEKRDHYNFNNCDCSRCIFYC